MSSSKHTVAILGSGNWATVVARIISQNVLHYSDEFNPTVRMYTFPEKIDMPPGGAEAGLKAIEGKVFLHDAINALHENFKYLPGSPLPHNVIADPDAHNTVKDASALVFCTPHQFVPKACESIVKAGGVRQDAFAISLVKGMLFDEEKKEMVLLTDHIKKALGIKSASILSGANVANEVAADDWCETTLGTDPNSPDPHTVKALWTKIFSTHRFHILHANNVAGVELCGALKNIVAVAAGVVDGMGFGNNTKAAIIRKGLDEMREYTAKFHPGVEDSTYFSSCGVADLITTCYGGRNRKVGEAYAKTGKSFEQLEIDLLNGQKLQGTTTALEAYHVLDSRDLTREFPLFTATYRLAYEKLPLEQFLPSIFGPSGPAKL